MKLGFAVLVLFGCVLAEEEGSNYASEYFIYKEALKFMESCGMKHLSVCLKEKALKYVDNLPNDIELGNGFRIKSDINGFHARTKFPLVLPEEARAKEEMLDRVLMERMAEYVGSHTLEFKFPINRSIDDNEIVEGRKRKGGGGGGFRMKSMLMLLQLKAVAIGAVILKFIGLIAFKALMMSKVALLISGVIALKKLSEAKHHSSTYEIVAHPHEDYGHYDRAFDSSNAGA